MQHIRKADIVFAIYIYNIDFGILYGDFAIADTVLVNNAKLANLFIIQYFARLFIEIVYRERTEVDFTP